MSGLVTGELLKLRTLRSTWGFGLVAVVFAGLLTAANIGGSPAADRLDPELQSRIALDVAFPTSILALLLGIVLVTNEFRHGTIARTLLATPRRWRLVVVKLLTGGVVGVGLIGLALVVALVASAIWLQAVGVPIDLGEWADGAWRSIVATVLAGVVGAALGGAVHSQVGALVGVLVWMFVLEPICWVLFGLLDLDRAAEYLPAAALGGTVSADADTTSWLGSAAVAAGWAVVAAAVAFFRTERRDIT